MFEKEKLLTSRPDQIPLVTKSIRQIRNAIPPRPGAFYVDKWIKIKSDHPYWIERKPPTSGYNCAGHIWASRRTAIYDDEGEINQIFEEDQYFKKNYSEIIPGDLVVYFSPYLSGPNFLHVGEILEVPSFVGGIGAPLLLSKFGDWGGEVLHRLQDVPFGEPNKHYIWEFWSEK